MPIAVGNKFKKKYETEEKKKVICQFLFQIDSKQQWLGQDNNLRDYHRELFFIFLMCVCVAMQKKNFIALIESRSKTAQKVIRGEEKH